VDLAVRTLDAGVHLLLEKPMAVSVGECERILLAAESSGAKLMLAYRLHYDPGTLKALEVARSGKLGSLRYFNSSFSQPVSGQNHRARNGYWAGPVPDMGPYPINMARNLFGAEPIEVSAMGVQTDADRFAGFKDTVAVNLRFPGNRLATMLMSYNAADIDDFRITGSSGHLFAQPAFQVGAAIEHTLTVGKDVSHESFAATDQFGGELKYFSNCILNNRHPESDGEEGMLDVRVIAAVEQALLTGEPQTLEPWTRRRRPVSEQQEKLRAAGEPELVGAHKPSDGR
jgi:predicted dehydrogenase